MSEGAIQSPIVDWAPFVIQDNELPTQAMVNVAIGFANVTDQASWQMTYSQVIAEGEAVLDQMEQQYLGDVLNAMFTAVGSGEISYGQIQGFWLWMEYNQIGESLPTDVDIGSWLGPYLAEYALTHGGVVPQDYIPPAPAPLPTPTEGQKQVTTSSQNKVPAHVTGGTPEGTSGPQVTAAMGILFVDAMQVLADVIDAFLPGLAPGQVPQALNQLNQAATILERQMAQVLTDLDPNSQGALAAQLQTAQANIKTLLADVSQINDELAEKAGSGLETDIKAAEKRIGDNTKSINGILENSLPELAAGLATLTGTVGALQSQVDNDLVPDISKNTSDVAALEDELSGTDKDCLDQLCDGINAATNPPGTTPEGTSPFSTLKNLITKGAELLALVTLADGVLGLLNMQLAVDGVVQDVDTIEGWIGPMVTAINADLSWGGALNL